jgi:di/tricarboxylate transporter
MTLGLDVPQISFLVILVLSFVLLTTELLRNDLVAVLIILALALTGVLSPSEALSGFGSEPAIIIVSIFVMTGAFQRTGLADVIDSWIGRLAGKGYSRVLVVIMLSVGFLSAFTHHVTTTALMLPVVLTLCRERKISVSKLLMPMSFAASLGTTITIIGAPAFLIANTVLVQAGRQGLGIFSIAPIGLSITIAGALFMLTIGRFLLPTHEGGEDLADLYRLDSYFTEVEILDNSSFIGRTVTEVASKGPFRFATVGWKRDGKGLCRPLGEEKLRKGDVLWVHATPEDMIAFRQESGIEVHAIKELGADWDRLEAGEGDPAEQLVQAVVAPDSDMIHSSLQDVDFKRRYGAIVLGLWRRGGFLCQELATVKLQPGDVLVLEGDHESLSRISRDPAFLMIVPFHGEMRLRRKAGLAGAIMLATIIAAGSDIVRLDIVMLAGAAAMVLFGCITPRLAYRSIDSKIYVFIAGAIPLGDAMQKTGTAALMAGWLQRTVGEWNPVLILLLIFAIVAIITQLMSDAATTALFAPIALALANMLGQVPEPYVITVAMAAVTSFLTPIGHHGNLLVYGPGRYQFSDFIKAGTPLTVIIAVIVVYLSLAMWR